jgi:hypothetical protein
MIRQQNYLVMAIVLSGNQQIYMVDLAGQKYISKYIFFPAGFATALRILMFG